MNLRIKLNFSLTRLFSRLRFWTEDTALYVKAELMNVINA